MKPSPNRDQTRALPDTRTAISARISPIRQIPTTSVVERNARSTARERRRNGAAPRSDEVADPLTSGLRDRRGRRDRCPVAGDLLQQVEGLLLDGARQRRVVQLLHLVLSLRERPVHE